jgi:hypothetical protein
MNSLVRLEETFTGYIAALQSRKGNIIGKVLRSRGAADELAINALYNTFIEDPFDMRSASEVSVDVIFVAFEKYLRMAWKDQMGQVISLQALDALQEKALKLYPGDFLDYVRMVFGEMAPQNRRAFIAIIKLLADLLEGCGNDGDRGALTAAFAELLVIDGQPHDYINLLDRLVVDSERLFEDIGPGAMTAFGSAGNSTYGSISGNRSNHSATGSLTSNASSLRRRFADTLLRSNSRDSDNRHSVWRTLSKSSGRSVATGEQMGPSSLSKGSLNRSKSIESPRRPVSRDRPTVMGAFDDRPSSSHGQQSRLSTIGASPPDEKKTEKSKKPKRRSSLSDLKTLMAKATLGASSMETSPLGMAPPGLNPFGSQKAPSKKATPATPPLIGQNFNTAPRTPSPSRLPVAGGIMNRNRSEMYRTGSPNQKENTPIGQTPRNIGNLTERPQNIMSTPTPDTVVVRELWSTKAHSKTNSMPSNIPVLKGTPTSTTSRPSSPQKSPQKLRLQSPQKLRERLQNEAKAINDAEASLRDELSKIGEEMARLNAVSSVPSEDLKKLQTTVAAFEIRIPDMIKELTTRNEKIKEDLEKTLQSSEYKVKGLDQLYKENSAETELLYEKLNNELARMVKILKNKGKDQVHELVQKVKEDTEEIARIKKENARLRRENVTLRALLKGNDLL